MNEYTISVIGAGVSGISLINSLVHLKGEDKNLILRINIFDEHNRFGRGNVYSSDLDSNLMNTKAAYLTYDDNKPSDFLNWLRHKCPETSTKYTDKSYVPRSIFGKYMHERWNDVIEEAVSKGIQINKLDYKISSIHKKFDCLHSVVVCWGLL